MAGIRHYYFLDSIGCGDWFGYGSTLQDVRYAVEGYSCFDQEDPANLPDELILHFPSCYGGDVLEGYGIYNYLRGIAAKGVKITSRVEGLCASIATLIALAADTVLMSDTAFWMVHKPHLDAGPGADANVLTAAADILNKIQGQLATQYVARSKGKLDVATAHELINKTSWLTADECLAYGFITGKADAAPLEAPAGTDKVLNYFPRPTNTPAAMATLNPAEKKTLFAEFKAMLGIKDAPKAEAAPAPKAAAAPVPAEKAAPAAMTMSEFPLSDGTSVFVDNSDDNVVDIEPGDAVYTDEAMTTVVADGEYTLEDGRNFSIAGGLVTDIDPAAEAAAEAPAAEASTKPTGKPQPMTPAARLKSAEARANVAEAKLKAHVPGSAGNPLKPGAQAFGDGEGAAAHPLDSAAAKTRELLARRF